MSATPPIDGTTKSGLCGDLPAALDLLCDRLVQSMHPDGFWEGRLSASALSTATAVSALSLAKTESDGPRIAAGAAWLVEHQNQDHGWGDTTDSPSNLATTLLSVAASWLAAGAGVGEAAPWPAPWGRRTSILPPETREIRRTSWPRFLANMAAIAPSPFRS